VMLANGVEVRAARPAAPGAALTACAAWRRRACRRAAVADVHPRSAGVPCTVRRHRWTAAQPAHADATQPAAGGAEHGRRAAGTDRQAPGGLRPRLHAQPRDRRRARPGLQQLPCRAE
jgi:hypothetical protein